MISPAPGIIWTAITITMNSLRPVKRYFATATAARNAIVIAIATVTPTMISVFTTSFQKNGWCIASRK